MRSSASSWRRARISTGDMSLLLRPSTLRARRSARGHAEERAERGDDGAAHGYRHERAAEARVEELRTQPGEHEQLDRDDDDRSDDRGVVAGDEERHRVEHAAEERPAAGDRSPEH